jgi:hypothetical protein
MIAPLSIVNSLLRVDGLLGELSFPFEQPNKEINCWVLELSDQPKENLQAWSKRVAKIIRRHSDKLSDLPNKGARVTLFIQSSGDYPVFRLEASFLQILAGFHVSIEHCNLKAG